MAEHTFTAFNLGNTRLSLDIKFNEDRALRETIPPFGSAVLPSDITLEELDDNGEIQRLIASGVLRITFPEGQYLTFSRTTPADTDTATIDEILAQPAYDYQITQVGLIWGSSATGPNFRLGPTIGSGLYLNFSGGGNTVSRSIISPAVPFQTAANTPVYLRRSGEKPLSNIWIEILRLTV